MLGIDDPTVTV